MSSFFCVLGRFSNIGFDLNLEGLEGFDGGILVFF